MPVMVPWLWAKEVNFAAFRVPPGIESGSFARISAEQDVAGVARLILVRTMHHVAMQKYGRARRCRDIDRLGLILFGVNNFARVPIDILILGWRKSRLTHRQQPQHMASGIHEEPPIFATDVNERQPRRRKVIRLGSDEEVILVSGKPAGAGFTKEHLGLQARRRLTDQLFNTLAYPRMPQDIQEEIGLTVRLHYRLKHTFFRAGKLVSR